MRLVRGGAARLVQLRNPWGELEWRGDWSDSSQLWTPQLRRALQPHGSEAGTFWMAWPDFTKFFSAVDVCRVRPGWPELRAHGAIPSRPPATGGTLRAFSVEVAESTPMEITLMQRTRRGTAATQPPTDMLLLLLRLKGAGGGTTGSGFDVASLLACSARSMRSAVSCEALASQGRYLLVPLSLHPAAAAREHPVVLRLGSSKPLHLDAVALPTAAAAAALAAYARRGRRRDAFDGMSLWALQDGAGLVSYAENRSGALSFCVGLDHAGSTNVVPSRGAPLTSDTLLPKHSQLVQVLNVASEDYSSRMKAQLKLSAEPPSVDAHAPGVAGSFLHCPRRLSEGKSV